VGLTKPCASAHRVKRILGHDPAEDESRPARGPFPCIRRPLLLFDEGVTLDRKADGIVGQEPAQMRRGGDAYPPPAILGSPSQRYTLRHAAVSRASTCSSSAIVLNNTRCEREGTAHTGRQSCRDLTASRNPGRLPWQGKFLL
jgi:hypothetical protein